MLESALASSGPVAQRPEALGSAWVSLVVFCLRVLLEGFWRRLRVVLLSYSLIS